MICKECIARSGCIYVQFFSCSAMLTALSFICQQNPTKGHISYFMHLFLEMHWVKEGCNLSGGKCFPTTGNIFPPMPKI